MKVCYCCGHKLNLGEVVGRHEVCPECHRDVRCCLNCALHDPSAHNQCSEPQSEEVREREQSNFCEFFVMSETEKLTEYGNGLQKARDEWNKLFKK